MKTKLVVFITLGLMIFVSISCTLSESDWTSKQASPNPIRQLVGLPSIIVGNLSPAARNPGIEILCTGLYDTPGGYCSYFTLGVPNTDFPMSGNFTVSDDDN